jgi:hypothetical protein
MGGFNASIPLQSFPDNEFDPVKNKMRLAQLLGVNQDNQLRQMQIADLQRKQKQQDAIRAAAQGAVGPQQGSYQQPALDLGGLAMPGRQMDVQGPAAFDRNKFLSNLTQRDPLAAQDYQGQFASQGAEQQKQQMAMQEGLMKLSAQKRAEAEAQLEQSVKGFYSVMSLPAESRPDAYQQEIRRQLQAGIIHPQQIGTEINPEYSDQGVMSMLQRADSIGNILKQIKEQQDAVPLNPDEAQALGKQPGARVPLKDKNTASEMLNRGHVIANTEQGVYDYNRNTGVKKLLGANPRMVFAPENKIIPVADPNNPGNVTFAKAGDALKQGMQSPQSAGTVAAKATLKSATSGKIGEEINANNTAIAHADLLLRAAQALQNGDNQTLNSLRNRFKNEFGVAGPVTAQAISDAYTREVTKMLSSGHMTNSEIDSVGKTLDPRKQSMDQVTGVVNAYKALASSKIQQRRNQVDQGMQGKPNFPEQSAQAVPMYATNPQTKQRIVSNDGGQTWQPAQ